MASSFNNFQPAGFSALVPVLVLATTAAASSASSATATATATGTAASAPPGASSVPATVTAVASHGSRVLVGTATGALLAYHLTPPPLASIVQRVKVDPPSLSLSQPNGSNAAATPARRTSRLTAAATAALPSLLTGTASALSGTLSRRASSSTTAHSPTASPRGSRLLGDGLISATGAGSPSEHVPPVPPLPVSNAASTERLHEHTTPPHSPKTDRRDTAAPDTPSTLFAASRARSASIISNSTTALSHAPSTGSIPTDLGDLFVLISQVDEFGLNKKPIDHLAAIEHCNLLFSVSDGIPRLHTLDTFQHVHTFPDMRNPYSYDIWSPASSASSSPDTDTPPDSEPSKLVIGLHKKLCIATLTPTSTAPPTAREHHVPVAVRSVAFTHNGTALCIASSRELSTLDLATSHFASLYNWAAQAPPSSAATASLGLFSGTPHTRVTAHGPNLTDLLAFHNNAILRISAEGHRHRLEWTGTPALLDVTRTGPYLLGTTSASASKATIHTRLATHPSTSIHLLDLPSPLRPPLVPASGGLLIPHAQGVSLLCPIPLDAMIDRLTSAGQFDTAMALVDAATSGEDADDGGGATWGVSADDRAHWTRAIQRACVHHAFRAGAWDEAMAGFRDLCVPVDEVVAYFPFASGGGEASGGGRGGGAEEGKELPAEARRALIRFLTERRAILNRLRNPPAHPTAASLGSAAGLGGASVFAGLGGGGAPKRSILPRVAAVASSSASTLSALARDVISAMSDAMTPDEMDAEARVVDMALVRTYLLAEKSDTMLGSLLRIKNECPVEETASLLLEKGKGGLAVDFYFAKGSHERALELLMRKATESASDATHAGPRALVSYLYKLETMPDQLPLIFKYLGFLFQENEHIAMEFVQDCRIDAARIVPFLRKIAPRHVIAYLEYLIFKLHNTEPAFHEEYARNLIELASVAGAKGEDAAGVVDVSSSDEESDEDDDEEADGDAVKSVASSSDSSDESMVKLLAFLRASTLYDANRILAMLPDHGLFEARLLLYERVGNVRDVLELLVKDMQDIDRAIRLVKEHNAYHTDLVHLCMQSDTCPASTILNLLTQFVDHLAPLSVVEIVSDLDPFASEALPILARVFASTLAEAHQSAVVKNLAQRENEVAKIKLTGLQIRSVTVEERTLCGVCGKRVGNSAIVTWKGAEAVVHFACASR